MAPPLPTSKEEANAATHPNGRRPTYLPADRRAGRGTARKLGAGKPDLRHRRRHEQAAAADGRLGLLQRHSPLRASRLVPRRGVRLLRLRTQSQRHVLLAGSFPGDQGGAIRLLQGQVRAYLRRVLLGHLPESGQACGPAPLRALRDVADEGDHLLFPWRRLRDWPDWLSAIATAWRWLRTIGPFFEPEWSVPAFHSSITVFQFAFCPALLVGLRLAIGRRSDHRDQGVGLVEDRELALVGRAVGLDRRVDRASDRDRADVVVAATDERLLAPVGVERVAAERVLDGRDRLGHHFPFFFGCLRRMWLDSDPAAIRCPQTGHWVMPGPLT